MKKFIDKIKNFFSAKDLDVYDNLPIEEQYYRLRIRSIKEAEKNSRFFLVVLVVLLIFLLVAIVVASFANTGETASAITASAQEEVPTSEEVLYNNYEINLAQAPLHFFIPYFAYNTLNPSINNHFSQDILFYQYSTTGEYKPSMFFVYQVLDNEGNIYYEDVCRAGSNLSWGVASNGTYVTNSNSFVGVTFSGSVGVWRSPEFNSRVLYPLVSYNLDYPFTIHVSSQKSIDLSLLKVRSCALHDLQTYGRNEERIWGTYTFTSSSPLNHGELQVFDFSANTSTSPEYPVKQSPDAQYNFGYNEGYSYGFDSGLTNGYERGYGEGSSIGYENGYNTGYDRGKIEGASNASDYSFLSLASAVFDAPIAVIVGTMQDTNGDGVDDTRVGGLLNFDLLGVNVASFLLAIFTVCLIIALVKIFMSKQGGIMAVNYARRQNVVVVKRNLPQESVDYYKERLRSYKSAKRRSNASFAFSLVGFVVSILLLVSVLGVLRGNGNYLTFQGFLQVLGDTYYVPIDWIFTLNTATTIDWGFSIGDWYVSFDFLKVVYNMIVPVIQILLYLCTGVAQVFIFLITFIRILFGY